MEPEEFFLKRKEYIEHYYKEDAELRAIRLDCVKIAQALVPVGTSSDMVLERANKFYNYIYNGEEKRQ
jgi:hypothetical protein